MNEWMFNDTPAWNLHWLLSLRQWCMHEKWNKTMQNKIISYFYLKFVLWYARHLTFFKKKIKASVRWNLNDYIIYLQNSSFFVWARWFHNTKMWWTIRIHLQCSHWGRGSFFKMCEWVNCVWPMRARHKTALPVGGLPISQVWLDRMELVHDHTVPILSWAGMLLSGSG